MARFFARALPVLLLLVFTPASADVLDDILEKKTLRVGVAEFVPWTMRGKSGELIGFEIDVARKIAEDMGVEADFRVYDWDDMIPALERGDIDIIAGGMAITPARALRVNFTRPLADSGVGLVTNTSMTREIQMLTELNNESITITTVSNTLAANVAEKLFANANLKIYEAPGEAEADLIKGRAHAYIAGMPEARFLALQNPDKLDLPIDKPLLAYSEALGIGKGEQQFLNFLDAWVTARRTDQWLQTARDYWFGTLEWAEQVGK